ncbi:BQ2448_585 [Microbotryum intermedium]|uniref:BQ2448_585 protein n=1 Tax=Microbotryum intermedium TaxID=269621 RepID=A0A238F9C1_9BASI|nr:BQ2448_585 [Microbotryum intermedium]
MEGQNPRWFYNPAANAASTSTGAGSTWTSSQSRSSTPSLELPRRTSLQQTQSTNPQDPLVYPHASGDWMTPHWVAGDAGLGAANAFVAHLPLPRAAESDLSRTAPLLGHHRYQQQQQQPPPFTTAATPTTATERHGTGAHLCANETTTFAAPPYASPRDMASYDPAHPGWSSNAAPPSLPTQVQTQRPSNVQSGPRATHASHSPDPTQPQAQAQSQRRTPRIGTYNHPESSRFWTLERLEATQKARLDRIRVLSSALGFQIRARLNTNVELAFKVRGVIVRDEDLVSCAWNHKVEGILATTYVNVFRGWRDYCARQGIFEMPIFGSVAACWINSLIPEQRVSATIVLEVIRSVTSPVFRQFKRMTLGSVRQDASEWNRWDQVREQCGWSLWSWHGIRQTLSGSMTVYQCEVLSQQSLAKERKMAEQAKAQRELAVPGTTSSSRTAPSGTASTTASRSSVVDPTTTRNESAHSLSERARGKQRAVDPAPSTNGTTAQNRPSHLPQSLPPAHPVTIARQLQAAQTCPDLRAAPVSHITTAKLASNNPGNNVIRISNLPLAPVIPSPIKPAATPITTARHPDDLYSDLSPAAFKQECAVFERANRLQKLINAHQLKRGQIPTSFEPFQMPQKKKRQKGRVSDAVEHEAKKQRLAESTQSVAVDGKGRISHSQSVPRIYPTPPSLPPARPLAAPQAQVEQSLAAPKYSSNKPRQDYLPSHKPRQPFLPSRMYTPTSPFYPLPRDFPPPPMDHAFQDYTPSCQPLDCQTSVPSLVELSRPDPILLPAASGLPTAISIKGFAFGSANTFASPLHRLPDAAPFVTQTTTSIVQNWKSRAAQLSMYRASHPDLDPSTINDTMLLQAESITRVGKALLDLPHVEQPARTVALGKLSSAARTQLFQLFALRALSAERRGEIPPIKTRKSKSKGSRLDRSAVTATSSGQPADARAPSQPVHPPARLPAVLAESSALVQDQATALKQSAPTADESASSKPLRNTPTAPMPSTPASGSTNLLVVQGSATRSESIPAFVRTKLAQSPSAQPALASIAPSVTRSASNGLVRNTSGKDVHPLLQFYSCVAPAQPQVARMLAQSPRGSRTLQLPTAHTAEASGSALPSPALAPVPPSPGIGLSMNLDGVAPHMQSDAPLSISSTLMPFPAPALDLNNLPPVPPAIQKKVDAKVLEFERMVESGEMAVRARDEHVRGLKDIILQARVVEQRKLDLAQRTAAKAAVAAQTTSKLAASASKQESAIDDGAAAGSLNALGLAASAPSTSFSVSEHNAIVDQLSGPGPVLGHVVVGDATASPSLGAERLQTSVKGTSPEPLLLGDPTEPPLSGPVPEQLPPTSDVMTSSEPAADKTVSDARDAEDPPRNNEDARNNEDDEEIDQLASDPDLDSFADRRPPAHTPYSPELGAPPELQRDRSPSRDLPPRAPPKNENRTPEPLERRDSSPDVSLSRIVSSKKRRDSAPLRQSSVDYEVPRPFIIANQAFKPFGSLY